LQNRSENATVLEVLIDASVEWRTDEGTHAAGLGEVGARALRSAVPWRTVRSYYGRPHYAGWYWSATAGGFVTYESRLELSCLLLEDRDESVSWIVSQPFLVSGTDPNTGRRRRHVPDFAVFDHRDTVRIINVKPADRLQDERVRASLEWAGAVLEARGWRHEIWTGADQALLANIRFLASYRIENRCAAEALMVVRSFVQAPMSIELVETACAQALPLPVVRPALLHHLWTGALSTDLHGRLDRHSIVQPRPYQQEGDQ
jgi:hypothetical protein